MNGLGALRDVPAGKLRMHDLICAHRVMKDVTCFDEISVDTRSNQRITGKEMEVPAPDSAGKTHKIKGSTSEAAINLDNHIDVDMARGLAADTTRFMQLTLVCTLDKKIIWLDSPHINSRPGPPFFLVDYR